MFTSTQSGFNTHPSSYKPTTSKGACNTNSSPRFSRYNSIPPDDCQTSKFSQPQSDLQTTLQDLQQKLQAKDGEVSILRSQLKELKANIEIERQKREKEWNDKLAHATKEMNTVKTQLDFKVRVSLYCFTFVNVEVNYAVESRDCKFEAEGSWDNKTHSVRSEFQLYTVNCFKSENK